MYYIAYMYALISTNYLIFCWQALRVIPDYIFWLLWIVPQWTLIFNCIKEWISLWHFYKGIGSTVSLFITYCTPFSSSPHEPGHLTQIVQHLDSCVFVCLCVFLDIDFTYSRRHVIFVFLSMVYFIWYNDLKFHPFSWK
jgi:hypothetical protein